MKCPQCDNEMAKGKAVFMSLAAITPMAVSFTADSEKEKGLFKRKSKEKAIISGYDPEAHYCESCNLVVPIIELK